MLMPRARYSLHLPRASFLLLSLSPEPWVCFSGICQVSWGMEMREGSREAVGVVRQLSVRLGLSEESY